MTGYADHFERLYRTQDDPWNYRTSPYEAAKYAATLAALTRARYASALEIGCSIGVFSAHLAPRCDHLLAIDQSARAVTSAAASLAPWPNAQAVQATVPADWPGGSFDLIVLSEVLYYLSVPDIEALAARVAQDSTVGCECVMVQYQGDTATRIRPNAARARFCAAVSSLRKVRIIDHPVAGRYNHRTLLFGV